MTSPVRPVDLDVAPAAAVDVVLALGANLGDRQATLRSAVAALRKAPGLDVAAVSAVYETEPVGGPDQPAYLNAVVSVLTTLSPRKVLALAQGIEADHGRERSVRWGARTLDVDVVAYGRLVSSDAMLTLPHPRAHARAFVLVPWAAVDPDAVLPGPGGGRVADLADQVDVAGVRLLPDVAVAEDRP